LPGAVAVGGVRGDEGGAAEACVHLRANGTVGTAGGGGAASRRRSVYPTGYTGHVLKGEVLEGGVLGVGVEVGVGVHLVEFGAFFLHGLADQAEDQARRISFPG